MSKVQSTKYASTFTYFMRMEDRNAADMRINGKPAEAKEELRPFIETNHSKLKLDNEDRRTVESISKEYGFTRSHDYARRQRGAGSKDAFAEKWHSI